MRVLMLGKSSVSMADVDMLVVRMRSGANMDMAATMARYPWPVVPTAAPVVQP
jgi:hypothetical protein